MSLLIKTKPISLSLLRLCGACSYGSIESEGDALNFIDVVFIIGGR